MILLNQCSRHLGATPLDRLIEIETRGSQVLSDMRTLMSTDFVFRRARRRTAPIVSPNALTQARWGISSPTSCDWPSAEGKREERRRNRT